MSYPIYLAELPYGVQLILKERERQIKEEGFTVEKDVHKYRPSQLPCAAAAYAVPNDFSLYIGGGVRLTIERQAFFLMAGWDLSWWKPKRNETVEERIKELSKAGALITAEIDRLKYIEDHKKKTSL